MPQRLEQGTHEIEQGLRCHLVLLDDSAGGRDVEQRSGVTVPARSEERREPAGPTVGHRQAGAEVDHGEPAVVEQPEVARVRVTVEPPDPRRAGQQEPREQLRDTLTVDLRGAAGVVFVLGLWLSSGDLQWRWALPATALCTELAKPLSANASRSSLPGLSKTRKF